MTSPRAYEACEKFAPAFAAGSVRPWTRRCSAAGYLEQLRSPTQTPTKKYGFLDMECRLGNVAKVRSKILCAAFSGREEVCSMYRGRCSGTRSNCLYESLMMIRFVNLMYIRVVSSRIDKPPQNECP